MQSAAAGDCQEFPKMQKAPENQYLMQLLSADQLHIALAVPIEKDDRETFPAKCHRLGGKSSSGGMRNLQLAPSRECQIT